MGAIMDILKDVPLPASTKSQLLNTEAEIENLNVILQKVAKGENIHKYVCPKCLQPKVKLLNTRDKFFAGQFGDKIERYKCENCGHEYDIDVPFHSNKPNFSKF